MQSVCAQDASFPKPVDDEREGLGLIDRLSIESASRTVTLSFSLGPNQSLNVTGEYVSMASVPKLYEKALGLEPMWKFRAVPVTVSYAYHLPSFNDRILPVAGAGLAAYFYRETANEPVTAQSVSFSSANGTDSNNQFDLPVIEPSMRPRVVTPEMRYQSDHSVGLTYGGEVFAGVRTLVTNRLYVQALWRYRYLRNLTHQVNYGAWAFVDNQRYSDFDLSFGVGYNF